MTFEGRSHPIDATLTNEDNTGTLFEVTVESIESLLTSVGRLHKQWKEDDLWFRGQGDASAPLIPGFYRHRELKGEERALRYLFQQQGRQLLSRDPKNKWEWYFLMQHHGLPTRLLDWSDGALFALHFALRSHAPQKRARPPEPNAAIWVLDAFWLNRLVNRAAKLLPDPEDPENSRAARLLDRYLADRLYAPARWPLLPIPLRPPHISPRIAAQQSCFTLHGRDPHGFERVIRRSARPHLTKIVIRRNAIPNMLEALAEAGIVESSLFPDLDGLGRDINSQFTNTPIIPSPASWSTVQRGS